MSFRTIAIASHCKLEYSLNYIVYRTADKIKRINLDEISTIIIQSPAVSVTSSLLIELTKKKIKVIFCDEKSNPSFELIPYYGDSISPRRINEQLMWKDDAKGKVWKRIVEEKIKNQSYCLKKYKKLDSNLLEEYMKNVELHDITNREGHAAKIYFNRVFYEGFTRSSDDDINKFLNYGYSILLSQFNKNIVSKGYLTQLGIHHKNDTNHFNLACDLMEPFRPIIDDLAHLVNNTDFKDRMIDVLNIDVLIGNQKQKLSNAISIYCSSIFNALNSNDLSCISFFESYEL